MFPRLKYAFVAVIALAIFVGAESAAKTRSTSAALFGDGAMDGVWFLEDYTPSGETDCDDGDMRDIRVFGAGSQNHIQDDDEDDPPLVLQVSSSDEIIMCVHPLEDDLNVVFDTTGAGSWTEAHCGTLGNECINEEGVGDDALTVVPAGNPPLDLIAITFSCNGPSVQTITIRQDDALAGDGDEIVFRIMCKGLPANLSLTAIPTTVESAPAVGNISYVLLRAIITDGAGNPVLPGNDVEISTTGCGISTTAVDTLDERNEALFNAGTNTHNGLSMSAINAEFDSPPLPNFLDIIAFGDRDLPLPGPIDATLLEVDTNAAPDNPLDQGDGVPNHTEALALFHAGGCDAGVYTVTFHINNPAPTADLKASVDITVIGPPAFITVSAAPTKVVCGEKSEISIAVTDVNNRDVSDNTLVEVTTNWGGVFGGTGSSLTTEQPVNPLSSTTVEVFGGLGTAFLLTSPSHVGPYEVLASSTQPPFTDTLEGSIPVIAQVTVSCVLGDGGPLVVAPDTGTGVAVIRPPNTGSGGLTPDTGGAEIRLFAYLSAATALFGALLPMCQMLSLRKRR